ncbi:MAG: universal stress protein [Reichenbachiella sp.]
MDNLKKILVALDNSEMDIKLIEAASFISKYSGSGEIKFINVLKSASIPDEIKKEFPNLMTDAVNERKQAIQLRIDKYFSNKEANTTLSIKSGQPTKCILKESASEDIDLIIVGRKNEKEGGGVIIHRLARRAACSLLIIPKEYNNHLKKLLVPIDFSDHSVESMNKIIEMSTKNLPNVKIVAQHVYHVPSGYHYTGKSFNEFAQIMEDNAAKQYVRFEKKLIKNDLDISAIYTLDRHEDTIEMIYSTALKKKANVIVIGAKGVSSTAALFLGSRAEKLIQKDSKIPVYVVRTKGNQKGLIEYLMNI